MGDEDRGIEKRSGFDILNDTAVRLIETANDALARYGEDERGTEGVVRRYVYLADPKNNQGFELSVVYGVPNTEGLNINGFILVDEMGPVEIQGLQLPSATSGVSRESLSSLGITPMHASYFVKLDQWIRESVPVGMNEYLAVKSNLQNSN